MKRAKTLIALAAIAIASAASAQPFERRPVPENRQLLGLGTEEAEELMRKLEEAQTRLEIGDAPPFVLLAGSLASFDESAISPRDAFLQLPLDEVWQISRSRGGGSQRSYELSYAPNGLGVPYWDVDVMLSSSGRIQRITLFFRPPAPF